MSKISVFLATLVLAAMLLTACGEETATVAPGTDVPQATMEATATSDIVVTETSPAEGTATPGIPVTGDGENLSRLSNQLDFDVWNQNGEQIGEVNDMVLDLDNTRVSYVIVGVGGILEIGEKDVLVSWDSLRLQTVDAAGGQENGFIYEGDQERLENAPDWDVDDLLPEMGEPAGDWDAEIRNYWESGVLPNTPDPNATAAPEPTVTTTPATGEGQAQPEDLEGVMLASDALGATVTLNQGQNQDQGQVQATGTPVAPDLTTSTPGADQIDPGQDQLNATVEDMIVDPDSGEVRYIVIDALFDDGERRIPVPLGFLQWDAANEAFVVTVDMAALQNAPFFQEDQFPDTRLEGWDAQFEDFWANPEAGAGTNVQATPTP